MTGKFIKRETKRSFSFLFFVFWGGCLLFPLGLIFRKGKKKVAVGEAGRESCGLVCVHVHIQTSSPQFDLHSEGRSLFLAAGQLAQPPDQGKARGRVASAVALFCKCICTSKLLAATQSNYLFVSCGLVFLPSTSKFREDPGPRPAFV